MSKSQILQRISKDVSEGVYSLKSLKEDLHSLENSAKQIAPKKENNKPLVILSGGPNRKRFSKNFTRDELIEILKKKLPQYDYSRAVRKGASYLVFADGSSEASAGKTAKNPDAEQMSIAQFLQQLN